MHIILKIYAFVLTTTVVASKFLESKPDFLKSCLSSDSNFNKCYSKNIEGFFHEWKDGIPGYKAAGTIDPLHVKSVQISQDSGASVAFNCDLVNVAITGARNVAVKDAKFNPETLISKFKMFLPKLRIDSDYKINGGLLNLALNGHGKMFMEIANVSFSLNVQWKLREENNYTFSDIEKFKLDISHIGGLNMHFYDLFNGQKDLEEYANIILNESWRDIYKVLHPAITEAIEVVMADRMSKIFSYVPANYVIEDIPSASKHSG